MKSPNLLAKLVLSIPALGLSLILTSVEAKAQTFEIDRTSTQLNSPNNPNSNSFNPSNFTERDRQIESQIQQSANNFSIDNTEIAGRENTMRGITSEISNTISTISDSISGIWDNLLNRVEQFSTEIESNLSSFLGELKVPDLKKAVQSIMDGNTSESEGTKLSAALEKKPQDSYSLRENTAELAERESAVSVANKATLGSSAQQKQAQMKEVVQQNVEQTNRESEKSMELAADSEGQDVTQNIMRNISQQSAIAAQQTALLADNQSALIMQGQQAQIDRSLANILNAQQAEELNEINTAQRRQDAAAATASSTQAGLFQMPGGITLGE
ncbi:MAG: hypothetical protein MUE44_28825 [Oscillatoriaceae cyanobacterium Prado104]|nr:hypothetical protein [Oscillatoriaceae cyanobacterium Prado104]